MKAAQAYFTQCHCYLGRKQVVFIPTFALNTRLRVNHISVGVGGLTLAAPSQPIMSDGSEPPARGGV